MQKFIPKLYYFILVLCFFPFFSAPIALFAGIAFAFFYKGEPIVNTGKLSKYLLQASVVLMGFGMSLPEVIKTGATGFSLTLVSIFFTLFAGILLTKFFKVDNVTGQLISGGTAICGGSAIAAIGPVLNAKENQMSFSLSVIFVLNAVGLFIFPVIGHFLEMDQVHFGYWAAIAIHDTSSVVGACETYGPEALQVGTTVKLTRTLWIIPVALLLAYYNKNKTAKISIPWFILFFIFAILISSYAPEYISGMHETNAHLSWLGKKGMVVSLFLIGSSIKTEEVKKAGINSFALGITLWIIIAVMSLLWIRAMY